MYKIDLFEKIFFKNQLRQQRKLLVVIFYIDKINLVNSQIEIDLLGKISGNEKYTDKFQNALANEAINLNITFYIHIIFQHSYVIITLCRIVIESVCGLITIQQIIVYDK